MHRGSQEATVSHSGPHDAGQPARGKTLFSIDHVDLNGCVADAKAIARINPHRGHMALLDRIVWHDDDLRRCVGFKAVRHDEFWVAGHFPGKPLYPGVLMVESAAQTACFLYNKRQATPQLAAFMRLDDTVFRRAIEPGQGLYLLVKEIKYSPRRFISVAQGLVDGQIAFETKITGMSLGDAESMDE